MAENVVALKLPTFWCENLDTWFAQVEQQFRIRQITQDETKFGHVAAVLDNEAATRAESIIKDPPAHDKYTTLKEFLIDSYGLSESERAEALLSLDDMGDRKPSQLMSHILHLYGSKPHDFLLKHIFIRCLPDNLRQSVAATPQYQGDDLRALAKEADRLAPLVEQRMLRSVNATVDTVPKRLQQQKGLCFFHFRFGAKSRNCRPPCTWKQGNYQAGSQ